MEIGIVFKSLCDLFVRICSIKFYVFGYPITFGAIFIFCGLAGVILHFVGGLGE